MTVERPTFRGHPKEQTHGFRILIPIVLFICITYAIKIVVDARVRSRMIGAGGSEELVHSILRDEEQRRRHSSLRWGIVLVSRGASASA